MRIALNLTGLRPGRTGGMEIYVRNLINGLALLPPLHDYRILLGTEAKGMSPADDGRFSEFITDSVLPKRCRQSYYAHYPWQWLTTMRELRRFRPQIHHCPFNVALPPWRLAANTVVTLHDVLFMTNPAMLNYSALAFQRYFFRRGLTFIRKIITVSKYSKQVIVNDFQLDPELVQVVYNGINTTVFRNEAIADSEKLRAHLPCPYLFFPGATWPYKNHIRLLQAIGLLRDTKGLVVNLVLTGYPQTAHRDVLDVLQRLRLEAQVHWLGWTSTADLVSIYQQARALVFPSLHEGFGLPIIEAMACGCPVLCSGTTACAEVAGQAAVTFDPMQVDDIAARIEAIWSDSSLRNDLVAKGLNRAREFTCARMAQETLDVFASL